MEATRVESEDLVGTVNENLPLSYFCLFSTPVHLPVLLGFKFFYSIWAIWLCFIRLSRQLSRRLVSSFVRWTWFQVLSIYLFSLSSQTLSPASQPALRKKQRGLFVVCGGSQIEQVQPACAPQASDGSGHHHKIQVEPPRPVWIINKCRSSCEWSAPCTWCMWQSSCAACLKWGTQREQCISSLLVPTSY